MVTEVQVRELLGALEDPFLHRSLTETNGITSVTIKEEKKHVSVKLAIAKTNTPEQMQLQMKVVDVLKGAGAGSVGIRFEELPAEALAQFRGTASESEAQDLLSPLNKVEFISIASGKGGVGKS
ncbi:MAG: DUF59 domain-containing protein, partial [Planococcus sp. (in: Bacteria)]|nr:DUF59 domain-containing protein [Planococcus sp. (in: firmicutes)]